jgi:hypothetical protein
MLLASLAAPVAADDYRDATIRVISAPDCVDGANFVAESDPAPRNATFMRVQHIGDPGTDELAGQVRNVVTWDVGQASGLSLAPSTFVQTQRGYRDFGLPEPASAFQLACNGAGFVINSRRFSHSVAVVLEGPSASIARELEPAAPVFGNATSALTIEATIRVPYMRVDAPPFVDGTAQVSFVYYVRDVTTGTVFPHVIQLFDNRPAGVNGAGTEAVSADVNSPFVVSPLSFATADGEPTQYVSAAPDSALLQYVSPWTEARTFRVQVSYARFKALLARLIRDALPGISPRPEDYRVALFGVLGEIFPGTGTSHEVALGASVVDMRLVEAFYDIAPVTVVEFYNASLDHYFISARADDIAALDSGRLPGWTRTGASFGAILRSSRAHSLSAASTCRRHGETRTFFPLRARSAAPSRHALRNSSSKIRSDVRGAARCPDRNVPHRYDAGLPPVECAQRNQSSLRDRPCDPRRHGRVRLDPRRLRRPGRRALRAARYRRGRLKVKVEPLPGSLSSQSRPPCSSMNLREIASPRPVPSIRAALAPTCRNSSNTASWSSGAIPTPVSRTETSTRSS